MTKQDAVKKINNAGIYQLRKGESIQDCLDYLDGKLPARIGYEYKRRDGSLLDRNQIIARSNREAFAKTVSVPGYQDYDFSKYDISKIEDYREDPISEGELQPCQYCGVPLRVDIDSVHEILNCNKCHPYAILVNCM